MKHFFPIVLIFSLTHTECLCCGSVQPPRFHNLTLTICSLHWSNGVLGAGEPPSLEKTFIEPFKKGNLAPKLIKQQKPKSFSFFFFLINFKLTRETTCIFSSQLPLIVRNVFLWGEKNCWKARGGGMMLPNFGTVVIFLFSWTCLPVACLPPDLFDIHLPF